jgi:hypothetical protein
MLRPGLLTGTLRNSYTTFTEFQQIVEINPATISRDGMVTSRVESAGLHFAYGYETCRDRGGLDDAGYDQVEDRRVPSRARFGDRFILSDTSRRHRARLHIG